MRSRGARFFKARAYSASCGASSNDLFDVRGRNVLITGGGSGIGRMISEAFVLSGANVYISSRNLDRCEHAAQEINKAMMKESHAQHVSTTRGSVKALSSDVSTEEGCRSLARDLERALVEDMTTTRDNEEEDKVVHELPHGGGGGKSKDKHVVHDHDAVRTAELLPLGDEPVLPLRRR